jgi:hypothetical protein
MTRPLRVEFAGALYHVTARGNERRAVYRDDEDRTTFQRTLGEGSEQNGPRIHGFCLMPIRCHLLCETPFVRNPESQPRRPPKAEHVPGPLPFRPLPGPIFFPQAAPAPLPRPGFQQPVSLIVQNPPPSAGIFDFRLGPGTESLWIVHRSPQENKISGETAARDPANRKSKIENSPRFFPSSTSVSRCTSLRTLFLISSTHS